MTRSAFDLEPGLSSLRSQPPGVELLNLPPKAVVTSVYAGPQSTSDKPIGDTSGGTVIDVIGRHLKTTSDIRIDGVPCTGIEIVSDTLVRALVPALTVGVYDLTITTASGTTEKLSAYEAWSPLEVSGSRLYDTAYGITESPTGLASAWLDRSSAHKDLAQATDAKKPTILTKQFGCDEAPLRGLLGDGTSGGGAHGPIMAAASKEALATGKTFFFVVKTKDIRTVGGTPGNVPNTVIGDANAGGWSGNIGLGGQLGDATNFQQPSVINWGDAPDPNNFRRMTFNKTINDGVPHWVVVTHDYNSPYNVECYVDGARITAGRYADGGAYTPVNAQATPLTSKYNAAQLGVQHLFGGKIADDDFFNGVLGCAGYIKSVVGATDRAKLDRWIYGKFIRLSFAWHTLVDPVPWSARDGSGLVMFRGALFLIGGWDPTTRNDIYKSSDRGATFTKIRNDDQAPVQTGPSAMFTPRHAEPVFVHTSNGGLDWIYVIGGDNTDAGYPNGPPDVWRTQDGTAWERVAFDCPWGQRTLHMAGSLNGKLYLFGGQSNPSDATTALKDVWVSDNGGVTWTQLPDAPWTARGIGAVVRFQGKLWMIGGGTNDANPANDTYFNDVWTFDGTTWTQVLANGHAQFVARKYTNGFVFKNKLWFGDGYSAGGNVLDLFFTSNGNTWSQHTFPTWIPRHADAWAADETYAYHCCGKAGGADDTRFFRLEQYN